jgi:hypothetical protein
MTRYLMYFIAIAVALLLLMGIALVTLWAFDGPRAPQAPSVLLSVALEAHRYGSDGISEGLGVPRYSFPSSEWLSHYPA